MQNTNQPYEFYTEQANLAQQSLSEYERKANLFTYARLGALLVTIPMVVIASYISMYAIIIAIIIGVVVFVYSVINQQKYESLCKRMNNVLSIIDNEQKCIAKHDNIYHNGRFFTIKHHAYASDLDVFGDNSLFHLLNRTKTYYGMNFLSDSLIQHTNINQIVSRQEAVKELEADPKWMLRFQTDLFALQKHEKKNVFAQIMELLRFDIQLKSLSWLVTAMPFISLVSFLLFFLNSQIAGIVVPLIFIINLVISGKYFKEINNIQGKLGLVSSELEAYELAIETILSNQWKAQYILDEIPESKNKNILALTQLKSIIQKLDYRLNLIVAIFLNGFMLWDLRILKQLIDWKESSLEELQHTFQMIGNLEMLTSFSVFAFHHQKDGSYPEFSDQFIVRGNNMIHPLMQPGSCVPNDFEMNDQHKIAVITGSNMSGKSTFLRTIGINLVLAYTGTKVMATNLTVPFVHLITYMRIKDSLEENVSTFKAELDRISLILEESKSDQSVFVLIDEMLRGTNSKDKLKGSIAITEMLIDNKVPSMIATHDIQLADHIENYSDIASNYYFDIAFQGEDLLFDYKIKKGICDSFNASFLLKRIGINVDSVTIDSED